MLQNRHLPRSLPLALAVCVLVAGVAVVVVPTTSPAGATATIQPDQDVSFTSGGVTYAASLRAPADPSAAVPAAVIVGGTGDVDRNGNAPGLDMEPYSWIADQLSAAGWASIRYDKLGTGATGLGPYASDPSAMLPLSYDQLRIQPARDALRFLAAQPGIDTSRLILIGHSEGGGVVMSVAHDLKGAPPIAGLALIEPLYAPILGVLDRQFSEQIDAAVQGGGMTQADADTLTAWMGDGIDEIRTGTPPFPDPGPVPIPDATDYTAEMQSTIQSNIYGADPAQMVVSHAYRTRYGKEFDQIQASSIVAGLQIPTLLTCGTKDFNTPCGDGSPGSGVAALATHFRPGVVSFHQIPDMVHILRDVGADDPSLPDSVNYPFSTVLADTFTAYLATFAEPAPTTTTTPSNPAAQPVVVTPSFTG
jgi:pimeloyl-ACP methyl ester carboxylesterase